ncbi:MAG: DNA repair and recombination protein RadA [Candidatus Lokiarchaeota archaeon]|nr:DNA repair and recombination protein RadA [Candidatus Lokiarchaeota archaeon]
MASKSKKNKEEINELEDLEIAKELEDLENLNLESLEDIELEDLKGVGPATSEKLKNGGFEDLKSIAMTSALEIAEATGLGESTCSKIIDSAKNQIGMELNDFEDIKDIKTDETPSEREKSSNEIMNIDEEVEVIKIEELKGVGPAIASKLEEAGYNSVEAIAVASPMEVSGATGVGETVCSKIIQNARSQLEIGFMTANDLLEDRKKITKFTTGSKSLDEMLGGGVETKSIIEVYGEFRTGKTQIAHQLCVTVQLSLEEGGINGAACYVDTEGTFRPERILQILERYESLDSKQVLDNIVYARAYNSDHQQLVVEKLASLVKEKNIKLVVIDSIISHFRSEYIGRGTLSTRQQKLNKFLHKLLQLAEAHNLTIFLTNQVQSSPGTFFGDPTKPTGGNILAHASTYRVYLRKSKGNKRLARLVDSPCLPESEAVFAITERGIED